MPRSRRRVEVRCSVAAVDEPVLVDAVLDSGDAGVGPTTVVDFTEDEVVLGGRHEAGVYGGKTVPEYSVQPVTPFWRGR